MKTLITWRQRALECIERVNELARNERWLESRRAIADLTNDVYHKLKAETDGDVEFSKDELRELSEIISRIRFSTLLVAEKDEKWKSLYDKIYSALIAADKDGSHSV